MLVLVFCYVLMMRILYKLSRLLVDWLAGILIGADKRMKEIEETIIQLKANQSKIRAQDEFAKYVRLERKINQLTGEHSELVKKRNSKFSGRRMILRAVCTGLLVVGHIAFLIRYRKEPVAFLPKEWFYPLNSILAFPTDIAGAVGLPCWVITSNNIISKTLS